MSCGVCIVQTDLKMCVRACKAAERENEIFFLYSHSLTNLSPCIFLLGVACSYLLQDFCVSSLLGSLCGSIVTGEATNATMLTS